MKLLPCIAFALVTVIVSPLCARAESSIGKVLKLREGLELKILELRRTKEHFVMFRYTMTNSSAQSFSGDALGFEGMDAIGAAGIRLLDMQGKKRFGCMNSGGYCVGSKGIELASGTTKELWMYLTEPPESLSSVLLQVGDNAPQPVTIDPAQ